MEELSQDIKSTIYEAIMVRKCGTPEEIEAYEKNGVVILHNSNEAELPDRLKKEFNIIFENSRPERYYFSDTAMPRVIERINRTLDVYKDTFESHPEMYDLLAETIGKICTETESEKYEPFNEGVAKLKEMQTKVQSMGTKKETVKKALLGDMLAEKGSADDLTSGVNVPKNENKLGKY